MGTNDLKDIGKSQNVGNKSNLGRSANIVPRSEDSWDGHMNTDYVRTDFWDKQILETRENGIVTTYHEYVTLDTMKLVKSVTGYDEFISGIQPIIYFKEENRISMEEYAQQLIDYQLNNYKENKNKSHSSR